MTIKRGIALLFMAISSVSVGLADSVRISQIDTGSLLTSQKITLYLSATDQEGNPIEGLTAKNFRIFESARSDSFPHASRIESFKSGTDLREGVNFLLLIDNSGSMYQTMDGKKTSDAAQQRITHAKKAVLSFIGSIKNPMDKIGLAAYNTYYTSYSSPTQDHAGIRHLLDKIKMPTERDAFYSEIYGGVLQAVKEFQAVKGRKAIIILSDGENRSYYQNTRTQHRRYGSRIISYREPLQELQKEGISLYVINLGKKGSKKDRNLMKIGSESGGVTFDAHDPDELKQIYLKIMDQIWKEYVVTYTASMDPSEKKHVKVVYANSGREQSGQRFYFASTVFGMPRIPYDPLILLSFVFSAGMLWTLSRVNFDKQRSRPTIEVLNKGFGDVSTKILNLDSNETIIGGSADANLTIAGMDAVKANHAAVVFDEKNGQYTLKGNGNLQVNNQPVLTRVLEPGDLINIDGVTMVFDTGAPNRV